MTRLIRLTTNCCLLIFFIFSQSIADELTITTLEWPPYTSAELPQGGATTALVLEAFKNVEMSPGVKYLPWKRAIAVAKNTPDAIAYYPGYHCHHQDGFIASEPIGFGPLGLAENIDAPITWRSLDDLGEQKLKIGTVLGYANTEQFDEKAGTGWLNVVPAKDDLTNLRKLLKKRIDAAVIDQQVLSYLLVTEASLSRAQDVIQFDEKSLEDKTLYLCFVDSEQGKALRDKFNEGLTKVDIEKFTEGYFKKEF